MRRVLVAMALLGSGCQADLSVPAGASIGCTSSAECPNGWVCGETTHQCRRAEDAEAVLPAVALAFTAPRAMERNVGIDATCIVAFTHAVHAASLHGRVHLYDDTGAAVGASVSLGELPNTFLVEHDTLRALTDHSLVIDPGVEPADASAATPSAASFMVPFTTGLAPDTTPPGPVTGVHIDWSAPTTARLHWTPPGDDDFAGVLIARRVGAAVASTPQARRAYAAGSDIGDATVIAVTIEEEWLDVTRVSSPSDYALFAFDRENNYSVATRPPFIAGEALTWSTDETGAATLVSGDGGAFYLVVTDVAGGPPFTYPASPVSFADPIPLHVTAPFARGHEYRIRMRAAGAGGESLGLEHVFWTSPALLTLSPPLNIGAPSTAQIDFSPQGWSSFEAQVDSDPAFGRETYDSTVMAASAPPIHLPVPLAGGYRARVRPWCAGCPLAPWSESSEFRAGNALYVSPAGSPSNDGRDAAHALHSITAALDVAPEDADVYVAEGVYAEQVALKPDVRLFGGYRLDFSARDRESRIAPLFGDASAVNAVAIYAVLAAADGIDARTVLDGFTIAPEGTSRIGTGPAAGDYDNHAIDVLGTSPRIVGNTIRAGVAPQSQLSRAIFIRYADATEVSGNRLEDDPTSNNSVALHVEYSLGWTISDNVIEAAAAMSVAIADGLLAGNTFLPRQAAASTSRVGLSVSYTEALEIRGNDFLAASTGATDTLAIYIGTAAHGVVIERNRIYGGDGDSSAAIQIQLSGDVIVRNNLIHAGSGGAGHTAILTQGEGTRVIANNTIYAGDDGEAIIAISDSHPTVVNNVLFGGPDWTGYVEGSFGSEPASFDHNAFLVGVPAAALVSDPTSSETSLAALEALYCSEGVAARGNLLLTTAYEAVFADLSGPDGDIDTLADNDWHVADVALTGGGIDASLDVCGGTVDVACVRAEATASCGQVANDLLGTTRVPPYSIGALE